MTVLSSLPQAGKYRMVVADPPWDFRGFAPPDDRNKKTRRDVEVHYPTMSKTAIRDLPVASIVAPDAHLLLWITGPMLVLGEHLPIMKAWGFKPSGMGFTWIKLKKSIDARQFRLVVTQEADLHLGLGFTTRKNAEFCVLGRRGNARRIAKNVREVILSPVREHSRKPDEFYDRARTYAAGPYLELFGRERRVGWDGWGNELGKFGGGS